MREANRLVWEGRRSPFYEIYYLKLASPTDRWFFWGRYTLLVPQRKPHQGQAALWGIYFQEKGREILPQLPCLAIKKVMPLENIDPFHAERFIEMGNSFLSLDSAVGFLEDSDHKISWDLKFEDPTITHSLYRYRSLYTLPFPRTKFMEPRLSTFVSGNLTLDRQLIRLEHHKAHQAHLWGAGYAKRWAWGHCNDFEEDPTAVFEGLTAETSLGPLGLPPLSLFCFVVEGKTYRANALWHWIKNESHYNLTEWNFEAVCGDVKFMGVLRREPDLMIGVEYLGPLDEKRYCHTTMLASMTLQVFKKGKKEWVLSKALTSQAVAFETVEEKPDPRVHFVL